MRLRFKRTSIVVIAVAITLLVVFFPGAPWSARNRHTLKRAIAKTEIRLARWRGQNPRLASIAGRVNAPGLKIEALDSRSGFAALSDNESNFVLPVEMWYPGASYELVITDNESVGKLIDVRGPSELPESGRFDVGELDLTHAAPVALQSLIGLNSITVEDFDSKNRDYYKGLFDQLTAGKHSDEEKVEAINDYVATKRNYEETQRELGSPRRVLERGSQFCGHLSVAMETVLSVGGYRSRAVHMINAGQPLASHAVVEVFYDGRWHLYDPTYGLTFRKSDGQLANYNDLRLDISLISEKALAKLTEDVSRDLMTLLPALYGTGYHHFFYFRGEQWSASKAQL